MSRTTSANPLWRSSLGCNALKKNSNQIIQIQVPCSQAKEKQEVTDEDLSRIYQVDFSKPFDVMHSVEFFALREQILAIEQLLATNPFIHDVAEVRRRISTLLENPDYAMKMAELGLILFYYDRDGRVPQADSLLAYRANEMTQEIELCIKDYTANCCNNYIPSGKTHYLMRAFAHMIFTSTQAYNRGGLMAIKLLLQDPKLKIAKYLRPEHLDHIAIIVDRILTNPAFDHLFTKTLTVHPDLADAIRIDLKLRPDEEVLSVHILYDCMMALFADVRQNATPNCYAIAALIYITENEPYKALKMMLKWLKEGQYAFNPSLSIPIAPLFKKRLIDRFDLAMHMQADKTYALTPFRHISETLSLKKPKLPTALRPIGQTLSTTLAANQASEHLPYAEKLYYAYKYNSLVHMQLAILEMAYMNSSESRFKPSTLRYSVDKQSFLDQCLRALDECSNQLGWVPHVEFLRRLEIKLGERLWLENCNYDNIMIRKRQLWVNNRQISSFSGNIHSLASLMKFSLRVFCLKSGEYSLVESFSDLQNVIEEIIIETYDEFPAEAKLLQKTASKLKAAARSKGFRITMSDYAASKIKEKGIQGKDLNRADLFVLKQPGGCSNVILDLVYGILLSSEEVSQCQSPEQFVDTVIPKLHPLLANLPIKLPIRTIGEHDWTLSTTHWKLLLENYRGIDTFSREIMSRPANRRLESQVPKELIERVIKRYAITLTCRQDMTSFFSQRKQLKYCEFRDLLLANSDPEKISIAKKIIEEEFSKITLSRKDFGKLLKKLKIANLSKKSVDDLFNMLYHRKPTALMPYQIAACLRMIFIEKGICIKDPYEIELELCKLKTLPLPIELGDLNYGDDEGEDPYHQHLIIGYSWVNETLCYFRRKGLRQKQQDNTEYENFAIFFPKAETPFRL